MEKKIVYETGATSHALNDLILFADNTRELAEQRDLIYLSLIEEGYKTNDSFNPLCFRPLHRISVKQYLKEFSHDADSCAAIENMSETQIHEFCQLYANDFEAWKIENL